MRSVLALCALAASVGTVSAASCEHPVGPLKDTILWLGYSGNNSVTMLTEAKPGGHWTIWTAEIANGKALEFTSPCKVAEGDEGMVLAK